MPLFSSKFAFKKSPKRSTFNNNNNSNDSDFSEDDEINQKINKRSLKKKKTNVLQQQQNGPLLKNPAGRKKELIKKNDPSTESNNHHSLHKLANKNKDLILLIDQSHQFLFDHKHAIWNELNKNEENQSNILTSSETENEIQNPQSDPNQIAELIDSIKTLKEENRLLKLKIEILIEMVAETTAELNLKDNNDNKQ